MERYQITTLDLSGEATGSLPPLFGRNGRLAALLELFADMMHDYIYRLLWGDTDMPRPRVEVHVPGLYDGWKEQLEHTGQTGSLTALLNRMFPNTTTNPENVISIEDIAPEGDWLMVYDEYANRYIELNYEVMVDQDVYDVQAETVYDEQVIEVPVNAFKVLIPFYLVPQQDAIMAVVNRYRLASRTAVPEVFFPTPQGGDLIEDPRIPGILP
ncbi:MAG: hypothetical protein IJT12_04005 [Paludibacteraceae bacterium]|nr:hypothetical protein [Paludibacteraceae bacterium]